MDFSIFESKLGYTFKDSSLITRALTHSTFTYESHGSSEGDNERLEFLGDCVLDLIVGDILFQNAADYDEGVMSKMRALIVCETTLTVVARELDLGGFMRFGKGEKCSGGNEKSSNLSSALEAVIAAVYLDGGYYSAYAVASGLLGDSIRKAVRGELVYDYKSRLLEYIQSIDKKAEAEFCIVREEGPDHHRTFFCEFLYKGTIVGKGSGMSKKEAEQEAARNGLQSIRAICRKPEQEEQPDASGAAGEQH